MVYKKYLLAMLVLVGVITTFERFIFSLALEPIKHELQLNDSQLGLMTGIAFAAFYAIAGIPIARWADRGNRATITAFSVGLLGVMVSLCSAVGSFFQLLLARAGVAVGEAGITPAGQSLLSDHFNRAERPRAMSIYIAYVPISMVVGYLLGGWLIESFGWRTTFLMIGLPGIAMAIIVKLTVKETRTNQHEVGESLAPTLIESFNTLWHQRTFRQIFFAFCVAYFFTMGTAQWIAPFLMRSHEMVPTEVGASLALAYGVFGIMGNYIGGLIMTRYAPHQERVQMLILTFLNIGVGVAAFVVYVAPNIKVSLTCLSLSSLLGSFGNGAIFAAIQSLVKERMRSVAVAITFLFANLIGFGLGPLVVGVMSDFLTPLFGQASLRYTLAFFSPGMLLVSYYFWKASQTIEKDIQIVEMAAAPMEIITDASNNKAADMKGQILKDLA